MAYVAPATQREMEAGLLSTEDLARLAGVSFRQLDHWYRRGVFGEAGVIGSGFRRAWDPAVVPAVRLLGEMSRSLGVGHGSRGNQGLHTDLLRRVLGAYCDGELEVAPGIWLRWTVEDDTLGS